MKTLKIVFLVVTMMTVQAHAVLPAVGVAAVQGITMAGRLLQLTTSMARNEQLIVQAVALARTLPQAQQAAAIASVKGLAQRGLATGLIAFGSVTFASTTYTNSTSYFQTYNGANGLYNSSISSGVFGTNLQNSASNSSATYSLGSANFGLSGSSSSGIGGGCTRLCTYAE